MTGNGPISLRWTGPAAAAIAMGTASLLLAAPASAKYYEKHLAVDCPQPFSQTCAPQEGIQFDMTGEANDLVQVWFTADPNPPACAAGQVTLSADGNQIGPPEVVQPGGKTSGQVLHLSPGSHAILAQMEGVLGGCNTGAMSGWSGTIHVSTGSSVTTPRPAPPSPQQPGEGQPHPPSG